MQSLKIEATDNTPYVFCDAKTGTIEILGRSIPENATGFYEPILAWLEKYSKNAADDSKFVFYLDYINSISQKIIIDILYKISDIEEGKLVKVEWKYDEDDEEMMEEGEIFKNKFELDFDLVPVC